jgi:hypothetical protein
VRKRIMEELKQKVWNKERREGGGINVSEFLAAY